MTNNSIPLTNKIDRSHPCRISLQHKKRTVFTDSPFLANYSETLRFILSAVIGYFTDTTLRKLPVF